MKNWKKVCAAVAAISICAVGMPFYSSPNVLPGTAIVASAESYVYENLTYDYLEDGTIEITGCDAAATELVIPSEINGTAVTSIGENAFFDNTNLTSVTLPDGVTTLGSCAFCGCSNLESITIPESLTNFGILAFYETPWLAEKIAEDPLVIVNNILIDGSTCSGDVVIPEGVTCIAVNAFSFNSDLTTITLPETLTYIEEYAFSGCSQLTRIKIPASVDNIRENVFFCCDNLNEITLSEGNTAYCCKDGVVFSMDMTELIVCPRSKTGIYTIPDSVTNIGGSAFNGCTELTEILIPEGVTRIGNFAFDSCTGLSAITIPDSVTKIEDYAFDSCTNLTKFIVSDNNAFYASIDGVLFNKDLTELLICPKTIEGAYIIPESVTTIVISAFSDCINLTEITIPDGVTNIEMWAFYGCSNLTTITIPDSLTNIESFAFDGCENVTDVYYAGSEDEWNAITIENGNDNLKEAAIHFGGTPGTSVTTTATTTSETTETTASASTDTTDATTASDSTDTTTTTASSETTTTSATTETTASASTEVTTTTTENNDDDYFASVDEMCEMAIKDYEQKHGVLAENAEATLNDDGTLTIELTDASGEVLETYTIDPVTGTGTASDGCEVNLPQTGNNSMGTMMKATGAALLAFGGLFAMMKSGIFGKRKKEDA